MRSSYALNELDLPPNFVHYAKNPYKEEDERDETVTQKRVDEMVATMKTTYEGKEDRLLPIYDTKGNLWWPKRMSYAEVQQYVTDRDKKS